MMKVDIKVDIDQTVDIDIVECDIEVDLSTDKIIENGLSMSNLQRTL